EQAIEGPRDLVVGAALCNRLRRSLVKPTEIEVVFDEEQDRRLVRDRMINIIAPCKRRDYEQRQTRTVAAATHDCTRGGNAALSGRGERVVACRQSSGGVER